MYKQKVYTTVLLKQNIVNTQPFRLTGQYEIF